MGDEAALSLQDELEASRAVGDLASALLAPQPVEEISRRVVETARRLTGSPLGFAGHLDPESGRVAVRWAADGEGPAGRSAGLDPGRMLASRLARTVLETRRAVLRNTPGEGEPPPATPPGHEPVHRLLAVPAAANGALVGLLLVANSARDYTTRDQALLERLATFYAVAVRRQFEEEAAARREERFRRVSANARALFYRARLAPSFAFEYMGPACEELTGYSAEEFYAEPEMPLRLFHPDDLARLAAWRASREVAAEPIVVRWRRRDGAEVWIEMTHTPVRDERGAVVAVEGIVHEVTERKRAEERLQRQVEDLQALQDATARLAATLDQRTRAAEAVRTCVEVFGARLAWIGVAEDDGSVRPLACVPPEAVQTGILTVRWDDSPEGNSLAGRAIRSGAASVAAGDDADGGGDRWNGGRPASGPVSAGAFPLPGRDRPFGVLTVSSDREGFLAPERVAFFQTFAQLVGTMLANAELFTDAERRLVRVQALRDIELAITSSMDPRVALPVLLDHAAGLLRVDAADILLVDQKTHVLEYAAGRGFRGRALQHTRLRIGEGHAGRAALERRMVVVPDLAQDPGRFARAPLLREEAFVSYIAVPLVAKGRVRGVMEVFHRASVRPDREWMEFLEALADQAAMAIENVNLFDELQRANVELALAYDTTLEGWTHALDLRDRETEGHTLRVTDTTVRLARALGVGGDDLVHIRRGALLHDIGKLGIPDRILLKPGPLDEDEWEIMRRHPVYAFEWLSPIA
jgi:PAS domain S-box-containing protein